MSGTLTSETFDRIWLEPREGADPYIGRQWCCDNQWGEDGIEYVVASALAAKDAEISSAVEKERLRFEGDLDKWMKIIGAGITGSQPEAYAVMDWACEELVKARAEIERLREALEPFADVAQYILAESPPEATMWQAYASCDGSVAQISLEYLRRARAALNPEASNV